MIQAVVIDNDTFGTRESFRNNDRIQYDFAVTGPGFAPDLSQADLLIDPNGADHVAMLSIREQVHAFLQRGGALFCFCGWFTDWVPGNRWLHDISKPTSTIRYHLNEDRHGLLRDVKLDDFMFNHGISGWWACGYIEAAPGAQILLADTWQRPVIVVDESSTPGRMVLTASGPVSEGFGYAGKDSCIARFYDNLLRFVGCDQTA